MQNIFALRSALVLACLICAGCGGAPSEPPAVSGADVVRAPGVEREKPDVDRDALIQRAAADAAFGFALQQKLGDPETNLAVSPYSVTHALALAYAGARGRTREQLGRALRFPEDGEDLHPALNALDRAIESRDGKQTTIDTANAAWGLPAYPWKGDFLEVLARHHGAGMRTVDFIRDREGAAKAIDEWVRSGTRGKIRDLFSADDFNDLTRLVLANAAYLKAQWMSRFEPDATRDRPFHAPDKTFDVPTMHDDRRAMTAEGGGWRAVELPYRDGKLAMLIVLPDRGALGEVERRLGDGLLDEIAGGLQEHLVKIALPRFRVESTLDLIPPLRELGATDAFDDDAADFTGMTEREELWIAKARQKVFVSVDEHGTEAAAVTGLVGELQSAPPRAGPFVVDRPFLFVIRDRPTGTVLFSGRVTRP
ncbi:MAG TPA: serpin family protein [Solirubrobacteraceae bacterium]|nr:serpin family protein [Solirubrobacteraceae bacterium]